MKLLSCLVVCTVLTIVHCVYALGQVPVHGVDKTLAKFDPARNAEKDISDAIVEAQASNRRIFLDVGGEWCVWCRRIDTLLARRKDIAEYLERNFVVVKVNYSKENKNEKVLSQFPKVAGYPHFFILESDGKLLHSQDTSELEKGKGHDPEKVLAFLRKWAPAH